MLGKGLCPTVCCKEKQLVSEFEGRTEDGPAYQTWIFLFLGRHINTSLPFGASPGMDISSSREGK